MQIKSDSEPESLGRTAMRRAFILWTVTLMVTSLGAQNRPAAQNRRQTKAKTAAGPARPGNTAPLCPVT